jgi:iron(III) transport system ATP-binding protein
MSRATAPEIGNPSPGLEMRGVSHRFGAQRVLSDVSLSVAPGELLCLLGPSGCGKSTLLRIAAGLETLQEGSVLLDGMSIAEPGAAVPPEQRGIGLVFQDYALFPHLNVVDNVAFGLAGWPAAARKARVAEILASVGMAEQAQAWPHTLSGGQQQRVALARALAPKPRVVLMDEPFSGLDARLREAIRDDTLHVLKRSGAATLMVTHDPEEAMFMADRVAVMQAGHIEQDAAPERVYAAPASAFVARFFGQTNEYRAIVAGGVAQTPLGPVAADGFADGTAVCVLVRPEGIRLSPTAETGAPAKVIAARLLGRSSWIHLCLGTAGAENAEDHQHLHARAPGRFLPPEGDVVGIEIDPSQVFVFEMHDTM